MNRHWTFSEQRRHAAKGQAITELALISGVIALMLLGIVEAAGAVGEKMDLQAATSHAARFGALLGNAGATVFTCPNTSSGVITDTVDMGIIQAISSTQGLDMSKVAEIEIYKAGVSGSPVVSGTTPLDNIYTAPFITSTGTITKLVATQYNWPSCIRRSGEPSDSLGVHVVYNYHPITPLFGQTNIQMDDRTVQRLNPTKADNPCPVPDAPVDVSAHWLNPQPSTTDGITFTVPANATSVKVYANLAGSGASSSSTSIDTFSATGGTTVTRTETHPGPAGAQINYQVVGNNYCGDGDISDPAPNMQYAAAITPTNLIVTSTTTTTPPTDYISWDPVPDAASYTITQTATSGGSTVGSATTTVTAPATSTTMTDSYGLSSPPASVTYQVAATSLTTVPGPYTSTTITPPLPPAPSTNLVGWWAFDDSATTYPTTTTDSAPGNLHYATLYGGATRATGVAPSAAFTNSLSLAPSAYASPLVGSGTNMPSPGTSQTITWWMQTPSGSGASGAAIALTNPDAVTGASQLPECSGVVIGFQGGTVGVAPYQKMGTGPSATCGPNTGALLATATIPSPSSGWHYYAFTYDSTAPYTSSLYIDNNAPVQTTGQWPVGTPSSAIAPTRLEFGRWMQVSSTASQSPQSYFSGTGYIDDVRIYTRVLTSSEVSTLYYEP